MPSVNARSPTPTPLLEETNQLGECNIILSSSEDSSDDSGCDPRSEDSHNNSIKVDETVVENKPSTTTIRCARHNGRVAHTACTECLRVLCSECLKVDHKCESGCVDNLKPLAEVMDQCRDKLMVAMAEMQGRQDKITEMIARTTDVGGYLKQSHRGIMTNFQQIRNEQMYILKKSYDVMERKLKEDYHQSMDRLKEYCKNKLMVQHNRLLSTMIDITYALETDKTEAVLRVTRNLRGREEFEQLARLSIKALDECKSVGEGVNKALQVLRSTEQIFIPDTILHRLKLSVMTPQTLSIARDSYSMHKYDGATYFGRCGLVSKCGDGETTTLIKCEKDTVYCVRIYQERIYLLRCWECWKVSVHSLLGLEISTWTHNDPYYASNQLAVNSSGIYVPNRTQKNVAVYSTKDLGKLHNTIAVDKSIKATSVCLTPGPDSNLLLCSVGEVTCINLNTKDTIWRMPAWKEALVACDLYGHVVVLDASYAKDTDKCLMVLDSGTGDCQGSLVLVKRSTLWMCRDLYIDDNNLQVLDPTTNSIIHFPY